MGGKQRPRKKADDIRDILLLLCNEHSGHGDHTITGMANELDINAGQVSVAVAELNPHLTTRYGSNGEHMVSLKLDIPTLEKLYATFDTDFYVQDIVMTSACFREVSQAVFTQFRNIITQIIFNVYPTWWSDQPPPPEEQKIFNHIKRDKTRAHVFELSHGENSGVDCESVMRGDLSKFSSDLLDQYRKLGYQRIRPPILVDCNIVISDNDTATIKLAIENNWNAVKFMLVMIDPENDTLDLIGSFLSDHVSRRKTKCLERLLCASYGSAIQATYHNQPDSGDPIDSPLTTCEEKLIEYAESVPIVDLHSFFSELRTFHENYVYLR